jgi:hypothetical protein
VPITRALEGSNFGPEAIDEIKEAYLSVIEALGIADEPSRELAARVIIGLAAEKGIIDAERLREEAIPKLKGIP